LVSLEFAEFAKPPKAIRRLEANAGFAVKKGVLMAVDWLQKQPG
jgi:hypothetical protein